MDDFKRGAAEIEERSGRPFEVTTKDAAEEIHDAIKENRRVDVHEAANDESQSAGLRASVRDRDS